MSRTLEQNKDQSTLTPQEWAQCLIYFDGACAYCGCTTKKGQRLTKDHLKPLSEGGATAAHNVVPACGRCNQAKGATDFRDWMMSQDNFSQERLNRVYRWRAIMVQLPAQDK